MSLSRLPAVAGTFYPADPDELAHFVQARLDEVETGPSSPKAMIVPHAGYIYSGPIAASAYAQLAPVRTSITRVVLLGPSHRVPFYGLALPSSEWFTTPLGDIPLDRDAMDSLADLTQVVVLDEAYHEFLAPEQDPDLLRYVREGRNVIILRTFSKIYGLAGLRVGYGIAPPRIIAALNQVREVFNTNSIAQCAAVAALDDDAFIKKTLANNEKGKKAMAAGLKKLGIPPVPTCTNFFFLPLPIDCRKLFQELLKRGVIVRPMARYDLDKAIRLTVGLPEENEEFLKAIAEVL